MNDDMQIQTLFESETLSIYRIEEADGEILFDVTWFDSITLHFTKEEWNEFVGAIHALDLEED